jgi:hypothetical protein
MNDAEEKQKEDKQRSRRKGKKTRSNIRSRM